MVNTAVKEEKVLNPQDLTVFCSQLALLVKSGIGLDDGMEAMGQSMSKEGAQMLSQVRQTYLETYTLSTALENAADAALCIIDHGVPEAANRFNGSHP